MVICKVKIGISYSVTWKVPQYRPGTDSFPSILNSEDEAALTVLDSLSLSPEVCSAGIFSSTCAN